MILVFLICGALFTNELVPATKWWHMLTYWFTWPSILGKYIKEMNK